MNGIRKNSLWMPRHRLKDNIQMDLREIGYDDVDWINLAKDKDQQQDHVNMAMNRRRIP
jgi:hypothetical protein